jgi:hypothetical protein
MDKIEDFGVHANQYYPLKVEIYKTKLEEKLLEMLWNKYWVATLSQSLILSVGRACDNAHETEPHICHVPSARPECQDILCIQRSQSGDHQAEEGRRAR